MENEEKRKIIAHYIFEGEKDEALDLLMNWSKNEGFKPIFFDVLEPLLMEWGKLWMQGKLSLAHGYISGKLVEEFLLKASQSQGFTDSFKQSKGTVVIGNIEDDFHPLGRKLVTTFARSAGWNMIDLGTDVTAEIFVSEALENSAHIIAASAMMFTTAKNIAKIREMLEKQSLSGSIKLAVGGAVFKLRPELVTELGGDGTADNAIEAPALFDSLWMKSNMNYL